VVFWPRLAADHTGLRIRTPLARADLSWSDVESVTADTRSRYGLRSSTLEVDAGSTLVVFSRRALGADPETVQDVVRALDPRAG
jgi:PH (Pleckstrin Homology) domain-containing protein